MPLCQTISVLAAEIEGQLSNISPSHLAMLSVLKAMAKHLEEMGLHVTKDLDVHDW